jgi:hypothetical protein|tara:strand:- start:15 stop:566 length:552 start_codon:yes stop_codon:yes gene_type:complete
VAYILAQKVSGDTKTILTNVGSFNYKESVTLSLCNIHATDPVSVDLYAISQVGADITDTGTDSNEADNLISTSSITLTVDGTTATSDIFADEKVWKSDGTLYGTCTARNSNTEIVFGDGLLQTLANNDSLYIGTRYYILKGVVIPVNTTLVLDKYELRTDPDNYPMYIKLSAADSAVDAITRK